MTDDIVARLPDAAEARVCELEAELAAMEARAVAAELALVKAAKVATAETIERCAKVAEGMARNHGWNYHLPYVGAEIAYAIRQLAKEDHP